MQSNRRLVSPLGIACIGCLAAALLVLPAAAGTNSWRAIGPIAYPFAVDPTSPSTIYAVVNRSRVNPPFTVYPLVDGNTVTKTTDGGAHWVDSAGFALYPVDSVVIDPASPVTIYVAGGSPWDYGDFPIYKSIDGGAHWAAAFDAYLPVSVLAIAPSLRSTLYAGEGGQVFKSIDGGLSWEMPSRLPGYYISALAVDPTNADAVYVA